MSLDPDFSPDEQEEKARLISQVLILTYHRRKKHLFPLIQTGSVEFDLLKNMLTETISKMSTSLIPFPGPRAAKYS